MPASSFLVAVLVTVRVSGARARARARSDLATHPREHRDDTREQALALVALLVADMTHEGADIEKSTAF